MKHSDLQWGAAAAGAGQAYFEVGSKKAIDTYVLAGCDIRDHGLPPAGPSLSCESGSLSRELFPPLLRENSSLCSRGKSEFLYVSTTTVAALTQRASAASTAVYGHPTDQAASSASSAAYGAASAASSGASAVSAQAAYASAKAAKKLDDAKDYVFSSWDDNQLRTWLEEHGVVSTPAPTGRAALLNNVKVAYAKATGPVYHAWSTSAIHEWLVEHGIVHPEPTARDKLLDLMSRNYWEAKDTAYSAWSESQMRDWLVSEGVM